jgi:hypothetical protein
MIDSIPLYMEYEDGYILLEDFWFYSERFNEWIHLEQGMFSDGATGAMDIYSASWWVHDKITEHDKCYFRSGAPISNHAASLILGDILRSEGHHWRSFSWFVSTWVYRSIATMI